MKLLRDALIGPGTPLMVAGLLYLAFGGSVQGADPAPQPFPAPKVRALIPVEREVTPEAAQALATVPGFCAQTLLEANEALLRAADGKGDPVSAVALARVAKRVCSEGMVRFRADSSEGR